MTLSLTSPAFASAGAKLAAPGTSAPATMPPRFATRAVPGGQNVSIPYEWSDAPQATRSFVLTLIDTAPVARGWVHWIVVDIPSTSSRLDEAASSRHALPNGTTELKNSYGTLGYGGPQPPIGTGAHPYVATLFALDVARIDLPSDASIEQLSAAMHGHVLASATYTGLFGR